jgi:hypothetical protein
MTRGSMKGGARARRLSAGELFVVRVGVTAALAGGFLVPGFAFAFEGGL